MGSHTWSTDHLFSRLTVFLLKRCTPLIAALLSFGAGEMAIRSLQGNPAVWIGIFALLPFAYQFLLLPKRIGRAKFWALGVPLWLFGIGSSFVFLYVPGEDWQRLTLAVISLSIALYMETEFSYFFQPSKYVPFSMERLAEMVLALGMGTVLMGLLGIDFLGLMHKYTVMGLTVVVAVVGALSSVYLYKIPKDRRNMVLILSVIFVCQLFWVLQFLPITFVVTGAIAGILVAGVFTLTKYAAMESLDQKTFLRTVITSGSAVVILLVTSRWT